MIFRDIFEVIYSPKTAWPQIKQANRSSSWLFVRFVLPLTLLPPLFGFIGASYTGWHLFGKHYLMPVETAAILSFAAWIALIVALTVAANFVRWMAKTYGANPEYRQCYALVAYSATPLFLAGILGAYPILWLDLLITIAALGLAIRILFTGVPIIMDIPEERGFLFASAILTVAMVIFVGMIAVTALFWGLGIAPVFAAHELYR